MTLNDNAHTYKYFHCLTCSTDICISVLPKCRLQFLQINANLIRIQLAHRNNATHHHTNIEIVLLRKLKTFVL